MEKTIRPGVKAFLVREGRLLMVKRGPCEGGAGQWELPGGGMEFGESPSQCLMREAREEIGLSVQPGEVIGAYCFLINECKQLLNICMMARCDSGEVVLSREHEDFRWVTFSEMQALMYPPMAENLMACGIMGRLAAHLEG